MMPSTGETSEKSRPTARTMWSFSTRRSLVGSKPTQPISLAAPHRDPGMGGVGALQARLARRRDGAQIAADIGRRQAEAAQACDHHMGKILADAVALLEHFLERRRDHGRLRIVFELGRMRCIRSTAPARMPAPGGKLCRGIGGDRRQHRHQRTGKDVADRRGRARGSSASKATSRTLSHGGLGGGAAGRLARDRHARAGIDAQVAMRGLDQHALGVGAEEIAPHRALRRPRPDLDRVRDQLLAVAALRLQPQRAARKTDRALVAVGRDVTDVVDHARPVSFSGRLALGPCGK